MQTRIKQNFGDLFEYLSSPLLDDGMHVVLHSCNAQGVMGSGFAATVKKKFPQCFDAYLEGLAVNNQPSKKMGTISTAVCEINSNTFIIVNIIGQMYYGNDPNIRYTSYDALDTALQEIDDIFNFDEKIFFHFPKIGSVRGGGSWDVVSQIIQHRLNRNLYNLNLWELKNG